jgi:UDP-N-acetylglucosamine/UDP-N-acetylgalactosamine diphosphorylase
VRRKRKSQTESIVTRTTTPLDFDALREAFDRHGQAHVFEHWESLSAPERAALVAQAQHIAPMFEELLSAREASLAESESPRSAALSPIDAVPLPTSDAELHEYAAALERGHELIRAGRLAVFVVAGGQGTRLGFPGPKGAFPVGPVTDRTLFRIQAQKIQRLSREAGKPVPWYVMTSDATHAATCEIFERERYFGLSREDVRIFPQQMVPAFDFSGRILLESKSRIAESPNGHGGALTALDDSGCLDDMDARGIDRIFYYQVDNPLVKIGDPVYLGFHEESGSEMSCKVVRKRDPHEKMGVVARLDGSVGIIEYTELGDEQRFERDAEGRLVYWAGNIAIHVLNTDFVRRVAEDAASCLPYHLSAKKIPTVSADGTPLQPDEPNGHKLERFVFDALAVAGGVSVLEVDASKEFSPIKNASGSDSPESSRRDLTALYRQWLDESDIELPPSLETIEIDHSFIDGPEDAKATRYRNLADAGDVIRVAPGMSS